MAKTDNLTDFLTDLADGIRTAEGTTAEINPQNFRSRVEGLVSTVTGDATAAAGDILSGKTAYVKGSKVTGTASSYNDGYSAGYRACVETLGKRDLAPLLLQGTAEPVYSEYYYTHEGTQIVYSMLYSISTFESARIPFVGGTYDWNDDIEYEVMISGSDVTFGIINYNIYYTITVYAQIKYEGENGSETKARAYPIDPESSGSYSYTHDSTVTDATITILGLRYELI